MARGLREDLVTQTSLEAYASVRHEGRLADRALDFALRHKKHLYSNERRAVAERVWALLRRQLTVDWLLEQSRPGFAKLPSSKQDLLRFLVSRLLSGEKPEEVKASASNEDRSVLDKALAAKAKLPSAGFAVEHSLPQWLADRLQKQYGARAATLAERLNERAPLCARVNPLKLPRESLISRLANEEVEARPCELSEFGLVLDTRVNAFSLAPFKEGCFEIQDEGSQLLGMLVDAPPRKIVDACAGAGGKSLQIAAEMKNRGELFCFDIEEKRLDELRRRARRADIHNVRVQVIPEGPEAAQHEAVTRLVGQCDRVFVDAPCSGTGTLRRKPDAKYRLEEKEIAEYAATQRELLERFHPLVKPGGRLVYGTCSLLTEENDSVVDGFLAAHSEYSLFDAKKSLPEKAHKLVDERGLFRADPLSAGTDGFFGAVMVKK
jgi:16S rRNA (cytosine967-C5)-methyltransferase